MMSSEAASVGASRPVIQLFKMSSKLMVAKRDLVDAGISVPSLWCSNSVRCVLVSTDKCRKAAAKDAEWDTVEMLMANRVLPALNAFADVYRSCVGNKGCGEVKVLADFPKAGLIGVCHACAGTEREDGVRTCVECNTTKCLASFDKGRRNACSSCRNSQAEERNVVKAAADPTLRICTGCNVAKTAVKFADSEIKGCLTCAAKQARHDAQPARREYHRLLNKEMQYWVGSRERERAKDEDAYLARNAATHLAWYRDNREHCASYKAHSINVKLGQVSGRARTEGVWKLTDDEGIDLILSDCFYTGQPSVPGSFGSIDRLDSSIIYYTSDNCVPAAVWANFMKNCLDVVTFLERAEHIAAIATGDSKYNLYPDAWEDRTPGTFNAHRKHALSKGHTWELTEAEFNAIQGCPCTFCLRGGKSTVDRIDNGNVYSVRTTQPLCLECNLSKKDTMDTLFIKRCICIADHGSLALFKDKPIERQRKSIKRREQ